MPEGDTIHRIARALARELPGRTLDRLELRHQGRVRELEGGRVEAVEARAKHLLIHFEDGWSLRLHLGMHGRIRRLHARQRRPRNATAVLITGDTAYVCDRAYTAELARTATLRSHPRLARLGPDLLAEPAPVAEAVRRAAGASHAEREIADVLLDQRVAAGIGNVYKSEALFVCRVHPRTRVGQLSADRLTEMYATAAAQLRANLETRRRTTVPLERRPHPSSPRLWVYGRAGEACLECGTAIERVKLGDMARSTYWCPGCQTSMGRERMMDGP